MFPPTRSPGKGLQQPQSVGQLECGSGSIVLEQLQDTCLLDLIPATSCHAREQIMHIVKLVKEAEYGNDQGGVWSQGEGS